MDKEFSDRAIFRDYHNRELMISMAGVTGGLAIGQTMNQYADIKKGSVVEDIHHWWIGLIGAVCGLILSFTKRFRNIGTFLTAIGLGITVTDLRDMSKQIDNALDQEPLTKDLKTEGETVIQSSMIPTDLLSTVTP